MWTIHGPWFMGWIKTSPISNMNLGPKTQTPEKETFLTEPQQCIQHLTPGWK